MKSIGSGQIEIESRKSEIEPLMMILDEWMAEHPDDEKQEVAQNCSLFWMQCAHELVIGKGKQKVTKKWVSIFYGQI